jgi:hypothetical protein
VIIIHNYDLKLLEISEMLSEYQRKWYFIPWRFSMEYILMHSETIKILNQCMIAKVTFQ